MASLALAGAVVAAGGTCAYAALSAESQVFGKVLIAGHDPNEIALTYDDGPNPAATPELLEVLAERNVRATFFVIGRFVDQCAALTREIAAAGHLVGNHTVTHPWLAWQSAERIRQELAGCNARIEDVLGAPVRYFRPPHGARRPYVLRVAQELGLTPVNWNVMAGDWNPLEVPVLVGRVEKGVAAQERRGRAANVLLHDGDDRMLGANRMPTVQATRLLLERYAGRKRFVTPEAWG